jgi:hypothetical protein
MAPAQARIFSAWMSGWFNHKWGYTTMGLDDFARNVASVRQWCTTSPQATVMGALERSFHSPPRGAGQDRHVPYHLQAIFELGRRAARIYRLLDKRLFPRIAEPARIRFSEICEQQKSSRKLLQKTGRRDPHERNSKHCAVSWMSGSCRRASSRVGITLSYVTAIDNSNRAGRI